MSASIIVTGGAGFIGRNIVAELNRRGESDILVVDHLGRSEKWRNLVGLRFDDYLDKDEFIDRIVRGGVSRPRAILHMGACSSTTETDVEYLMRNNYGYTRTLCEWSLAGDTRFVYASSAATYGDGSLVYSDADVATPNLRPLNAYGFSKHLFDLWALRSGALDRIAGLKFFNVYGPHEDHKGEMRSVVHKAYGQIRDTGEAALFKSYRADCADGEQVRDFIHVADAVGVALHFLDPASASGLFNCGTGRARSWIDLARAVFRAMNREPRIRFIDMPEAVREKYQYRTQADTAKLHAAGYGARFLSLEEGVLDYVKTHLSLRTTKSA
jgi:ADP-L-glycero-D-manno-heptose 6-epimerase